MPTIPSDAEQAIRVGVDVGGTFTDFVLFEAGTGVVARAKRPTSPGDPAGAIADDLTTLMSNLGIGAGDLRAISHATTLVTNALIERKGAVVGLLTTKGFRDVLETGHETRHDLFDLFLARPEPLVPRRLRLSAAERIDASGRVLVPLNERDVDLAADAFLDAGVEAVAVCFLHSYRNPSHEKAAGALLGQRLPGVPVTLSSDIAPEIREYERTSTAAANAYVHPMATRLFGSIERCLSDVGYARPVSIMLSAGGLASADRARAHPIQVLESGPAAGAIAAAQVSREIGLSNTVSFDMGGTTAKLCFIADGEPRRAHMFEAARVDRFKKGSGLPLVVPAIDLIEIGAGGGSIAYLDRLGLLKVGPESAGADPGPAAYRRGGTKPTVTDADIVTGLIGADSFGDCGIELDVAAARSAIEAHIASPLGLPVDAAAAGIHDVVNETMAVAGRMHAAETGWDLRGSTMVAFGGAGPVHAWALARSLRIPRIVVPPGAAVLSAHGLLVAQPIADRARGYPTRLDDMDWSHADALMSEMEAEARRALADTGSQSEEVSVRRSIAMRYVGQGYEIDVPIHQWPTGACPGEALAQAFVEEYERVFGRRVSDVPVEAVTWRVSAIGRAPSAPLPAEPTRRQSEPTALRRMRPPGSGETTVPVYSRAGLSIGFSLLGPAAIADAGTTIVVGPGARAAVDSRLNLVIDL